VSVDTSELPLVLFGACGGVVSWVLLLLLLLLLLPPPPHTHTHRHTQTLSCFLVACGSVVSRKRQATAPDPHTTTGNMEPATTVTCYYYYCCCCCPAAYHSEARIHVFPHTKILQLLRLSPPLPSTHSLPPPLLPLCPAVTQSMKPAAAAAAAAAWLQRPEQLETAFSQDQKVCSSTCHSLASVWAVCNTNILHK